MHIIISSNSTIDAHHIKSKLTGSLSRTEKDVASM